MNMIIGPQDITIKIKLSNRSDNLLAQVSITLFGEWIEHGWRIMKSKNLDPITGEYIWIQSPCFKTPAGYKEMVFIDNRKLYQLLQEKIYDAYLAEKRARMLDGTYTEETKDNSIIPESNGKDVSDEIPF